MSDNWWRSHATRATSRAIAKSKSSRQAQIVVVGKRSVYVCALCGKRFPVGTVLQKYCSTECRRRAAMLRKYKFGYVAALDAKRCERCGAEESIALLLKPVMLGRRTLLCEVCECEARGVEFQSDIGRQRRAAARAERKPQVRRAQPDEADRLESTYRRHWGGRRK